MRKVFFILICFIIPFLHASGQSLTIFGQVNSAEGSPVFATVKLNSGERATTTDSIGRFQLNGLATGVYDLNISAIGYRAESRRLRIDSDTTLNFSLRPGDALDEVVVSGTMKEVSKLASPVPVEVYSASFFKRNPVPSVFDALQNINGVRPQLNCNICNTGDIHINGLEGPYTMILIDGMPIVSGLSSVYGLSGIPSALIERVEVVKGPASSLYGSEAVGGLINVITKAPAKAPRLSFDAFTTDWGEVNTDIGFRTSSEGAQSLTGLNYFRFANPIDRNGDLFTDVTQQDRISIFQKWSFQRKYDRSFNLAGRFNYEDRWGGETTWTPAYRGGMEKYGESIFTTRWELLGDYQLPFRTPLNFSFSINDHNQNSVYGLTDFSARQKIAFGQLTWNRSEGKHDLLLGTALRYTYYDDNTPATHAASKIWLPGLFVQDEIALSASHTLLLGARYDYNSAHGSIFTPRIAYKWSINEDNILRLNAGTGFRVVSLFTEEHAALTGSRDLIVLEGLKPETSYNANANYIRKFWFNDGSLMNLDISAWYTYFNNQIIPDYLSNPNQIVYKNLNGFAVSRGLSANVDLVLMNGLKVIAGASLLDVFFSNAAHTKGRPLLTERWTGIWSLSYRITRWNLALDYTGNIYGPMKLPLVSDLDPRNGTSPVWSIQNFQFTFGGWKSLELYGGVKNLLNWTPAKNAPFLIARAEDPFDQQVVTDATGRVLPSPGNPYALTFDPAYVYAPNQGIRTFLGLRLNLK